MILLSAKNVCKTYVEKILLNDVSFYLNKGDKVGIVGVNGTGKSTFLKILANQEYCNSGEVITSNGVNVACLPQNPVFEEHLSILEQVLKDIPKDIKEQKQHEAKSILNKMGIKDLSKDINTLSGGEKRRVAIATTLILPSNVLILDEPTNHIDNDTVEWLEKYLSKYNGAIVMVTHDRYFLDRVANTIVELDKENLYTYEDANFSKYVELKVQREEMALSTERKNKSLYRKELEWIKRGPRARGTKSKDRIERFKELSERDIPKEEDKLSISSISSRLGKTIIEFDNVSKSFGDRLLIDNFSYIISKDSRIGIVGKNGCGKSTLLKMIMGDVPNDTGTIKIGETVKIGYFSQECEQLDHSQKVIDYIRDTAEYIDTKDGKVSASQLLERFLFPSDLQWSVIGKLSGGERKRLFLLKILISSPNVLLLDEPTNDLDIQTLEVLEDYLESFNGAVVSVSHDRYFLDKMAKDIFEFMGDGTINHYTGNYSDYLTKRTPVESTIDTLKDKTFKQNKPNLSNKLKFSFKEQREFDTIDQTIADLEDKISSLDAQIEQNSTDYIKVTELSELKQQAELELEQKMDRWIYLNELAEKINNQ